VTLRGWLCCILLALPAGSAAPQSDSLDVTLHARAVQPGEVVRFDLRPHDPQSTVSITAFGRAVQPFRGDDGTWRALVGIDLDAAPGESPVVITARAAAGTEVTRTETLRIEAKEFPSRTLRVDPRFVTPPKSAEARIARERAELGRLFRTTTSSPEWRGPFVAPIDGAVVSGFGVRSVFNNEARAPHGGADFASPEGTPILAPNAGRVALAADLYFTGNTVVLDHGAGLQSLFAHLSRIDVQQGHRVERGAILGAVGATGRATGPHLHWAVRLNGARVDPISLIAALSDAGPAATTSARPAIAIDTSIGTIRVELYPDRAPATVANFLRYVDDHFFDGTAFYRTVTTQPDNQPDKAIKIDVIQGGDDDKRKGYAPVPLERTSVTRVTHVDGAISMARDGPDTATSEFFICVGEQKELDFGGRRNPDGQGFAAFGKVIDGMDVVRRIHDAPVREQRLTPPIAILRITRTQ
jgi:peptidyl-prolyl cis-trans isomerase A (cyclophilin A)